MDEVLTPSAEVCNAFPMSGGQYDWTCEQLSRVGRFN